MAKVVYNDLILPFPQITSFKNEVVYEEEGETDYYLSKFDISVMCVINLRYLKLLDPNSVLGGTSQTVNLMKCIRQRLSEPRRPLVVSFNGYDLIPNAIGPGSVDARNGPQPKSCDFLDLTNNTFMLTWRVVANYWEKLSGFGDDAVNVPGANVLFNRWSDTQDIDDCGFTERTRQGVFAIRSDNAAGDIADALRTQMAVVSIPEGFTRKKANYTVQPDGLRMRYVLVDQEQFKMPPDPAKKAEGTFSETVGKGEGKRTGSCTVKLWGSKTDDQAQLISTAVAICASKLKLRTAQFPTTGVGSIIEHCKVAYGLWSNWASCDMQAMYALSKGRVGAVDGVPPTRVNAFEDVDTTLPFSDGLLIQPDYPTYGTVGPLLTAAKYYDPSLQGVVVRPDNFTAGLEVGTAGVNVEPAHYTPQAPAP